MKVLGLNSKLKIGSSKYLVKKISKQGVEIQDDNSSITLFSLKDIVENLNLKTMSVEKV